MQHKRGRQELVEKVVSMVLTSSLEDLSNMSVASIARKLEVNYSYLSREFKRATNMFLSDYIRTEKLQRAKTLLKDKHELNIKNIALIVGFEKYDHFRKIFKNIFHISPGRLRKFLDYRLRV